MNMLILGIDDSGRGPLIGPMVLAGVLLEEKQEKFLKEEGVDDSKKITHPKRILLAGIIKDNSIAHKICLVFPEKIDHSILTGTNLNTLEAITCGQIISELRKERKERIRVIVDCPSVNINAWRNTLLGFIEDNSNLDVVCEHKADANHPSVSAASIIAKVAREEEVEKLQKEYGNIGSGYPSDPVTKEFLKKNGIRLRDSGIFRKTWATWKQMFPEDNQKTLGEF